MVQLVCLLVGVRDGAFPMAITVSEAVPDLKVLIKAANPNWLQAVDANERRLFRAAFGDGTATWLASEMNGARALQRGEMPPAVDTLVRAQDAELQAVDTIQDAVLDGTLPPASSGQIHVLVVVVPPLAPPPPLLRATHTAPPLDGLQRPSKRVRVAPHWRVHVGSFPPLTVHNEDRYVRIPSAYLCGSGVEAPRGGCDLVLYRRGEVDGEWNSYRRADGYGFRQRLVSLFAARQIMTDVGGDAVAE